MDYFKCKITIGFIAIVILGINIANSNELKAIDRTVALQVELKNFFSENALIFFFKIIVNSLNQHKH